MSDFATRFQGLFPNKRVAEIARILGLPDPTVRNYFAGRLPAPEQLVKIQNLTNVSIDWLLTGEGPMLKEETPTNLIEETTSEAAEEEEFAAMFYNYRDLTEEDKDELRGLMAYVDHEIARRKKRREQNPRTADPARMESARSHKR